MSQLDFAPLESDRLILWPLRPEWIALLMSDPAAFADRAGFAAASGWADASFLDILPSLADAIASDPEIPAWNRLIVRKADGALIGTVGSVTPPHETGSVEIGYSIAPGERCHGYATEAAGRFIDWAWGDPRVREILAACDAGNLPSRRVLGKLGFAMVAISGSDHVWRLARPPGSPQAAQPIQPLPLCDESTDSPPD
jgi:RimJ/RimL family protein N-acetyltransferase